MPHKDPEKRKAYQAARYERKKAVTLKKVHEYYEAHREEIFAQKKIYRVTHRAQISERQKLRWWREREKNLPLQRARYKQRAEIIRKNTLQKRFGLTVEAYEKILQSQKGVCAICSGVNKNGMRLAVDHDHATGQVRGLLCSSCNILVGHLKDSQEKIYLLLEYLRSHAQLHFMRETG